MKLIALSGKRGVGKSTLARFIEDEEDFIKLSFADELRKIAKMVFPSFTELDFSDTKKKEKYFKDYLWTPREFLVRLGEFIRFHDEDYFINLLTKKMRPEGKYIIDDCRYINEADKVKSLGGIMVRLNRFEKHNPFGKNLDIESEMQLDHYRFDYIVEDCRNTSLAELESHGKKILELL